MRHRRGGRWGDNQVRRSVVVFGVDPVARGFVGAIDAAWSNGMAGRTGAIRIGESSTAEFRWSGYTAYQRLWAIPYGAQLPLRSPNIGLPSTHGDVRTVGAVSRVQDHLRVKSPRVRR
ncbi:MAG TPA: hypothetical protein VGX21_13310 [Methylomirabilota bacterium]|jgi:hypothetical protein|nr:hypothetical protein [Methylomirabilota bacterium]